MHHKLDAEDFSNGFILCVQIPVQDRLLVKKSIVGLMLKNPESIQRQLSDAITSIGKWRIFPQDVSALVEGCGLCRVGYWSKYRKQNNI